MIPFGYLVYLELELFIDMWTIQNLYRTQQQPPENRTWDRSCSQCVSKYGRGLREEGCKGSNSLRPSCGLVSGQCGVKAFQRAGQSVDVPWRSFIIFSIPLALRSNEYSFLNLELWVSICLPGECLNWSQLYLLKTHTDEP